MGSYKIKEFLMSKANLTGLSIASIIEMLQLFSFIDATAPIWALAGYGLGFVLMHRSNDGKCPPDLAVTEQLEWAHMAFLKTGANSAISREVSKIALRLEEILKQYEALKLKEFSYAKTHSEVVGLITLYFVPAIEAYLNVPIMNMHASQADAALKTQLDLIEKLLDHHEAQLVQVPLEMIKTKTDQLEQIVREKKG